MALRVRSRVGKYRIVSRLAVGGFAEVYAAFDTIQCQRVALKVQRKNAPRDEVELFRKEIRLMSRLDHPNVLPILNADEIDGRLMVAHPLGEESLDWRLQRRMAVDKIHDIFEQLLEALAYAHAKRIMHCDVKPANVILFDGTDARLSDFGLARHARKTVVASGSGTLGYMSPEQAMGRPSFRSDVFSAAMILYRMLTGELPEWPFRWPLPAHAKLRRKASAAQIAFLRRCLQVDHRKRYANAGTMLRMYHRAMART